MPQLSGLAAYVPGAVRHAGNKIAVSEFDTVRLQELHCVFLSVVFPWQGLQPYLTFVLNMRLPSCGGCFTHVVSPCLQAER